MDQKQNPSHAENPPPVYQPEGNPPPVYAAQPQGAQPPPGHGHVYPTQGYQPSGQPPQAYPPQGYPPQGYPPQGYPPQGYPHHGYPPQGQPQGEGYNAGHQTVVIQQPGMAVVGPIRYGQNPQPMTCIYCQAQIVTATEKKIGNMNWMVAGGICLAGLALSGLTWLGCQFIPLCIPGLKDVEHTCPNCHKVVGVYNRMS